MSEGRDAATGAALCYTLPEMPSCPRCGGLLYPDADPDGERYWRYPHLSAYQGPQAT